MYAKTSSFRLGLKGLKYFQTGVNLKFSNLKNCLKWYCIETYINPKSSLTNARTIEIISNIKFKKKLIACYALIIQSEKIYV